MLNWLPGVRIDRAAYLRTALKRHCTEGQIERAIADAEAAVAVETANVEAEELLTLVSAELARFLAWARRSFVGESA